MLWWVACHLGGSPQAMSSDARLPVGAKQSSPGSRATTQPAVMQAALGGHSLLHLFQRAWSHGPCGHTAGQVKSAWNSNAVCLE